MRQTHGQNSLNVCHFVYGHSMWHAINTDIKSQQMNSFSEIIHAAAKSPYNTDFICCSNINGRKIYRWDKLGLTINSAIIYCSCSVWLLLQRHVNMACVWNKVIVSRWHDFRKTADYGAQPSKPDCTTLSTTAHWTFVSAVQSITQICYYNQAGHNTM